MKPNSQNFSTKELRGIPSSDLEENRFAGRKISSHRNSDETGMIAETSLKLFLSILISLIATVSLAKLLPYHFAQLDRLKELRTQVRETEHRVSIKRQQLEKNFDSSRIQALMEEHSPRISQNRVRVFWQNKTSQNQ